MPVYRTNASIMLDDIRRIIGCPGDESGHMIQPQQQEQQQVPTPEERKLRPSVPYQLPLLAGAYLALALLAAMLGMRQRARRKKKTGSVS
jgi:hypothetical protein